MNATLGKITRHTGLADMVTYSVPVTYPNEPTATVAFSAPIHGGPGPVVMVTPANPRGMFVTDPGRFGPELSPEWVRRFFA